MPDCYFPYRNPRQKSGTWDPGCSSLGRVCNPHDKSVEGTMNRYAYLLLLALPAATFAQDQKAAATATIGFYRPHRFEGAALKPPLAVDAFALPLLPNGHPVQLTLNPA